jgi:hypothetical protein
MPPPSLSLSRVLRVHVSSSTDVGARVVVYTRIVGLTHPPFFLLYIISVYPLCRSDTEPNTSAPTPADAGSTCKSGCTRGAGHTGLCASKAWKLPCEADGNLGNDLACDPNTCGSSNKKNRKAKGCRYGPRGDPSVLRTCLLCKHHAAGQLTNKGSAWACSHVHGNCVGGAGVCTVADCAQTGKRKRERPELFEPAAGGMSYRGTGKRRADACSAPGSSTTSDIVTRHQSMILQTPVEDASEVGVRCAFFDKYFHSRMPLG